MEDCKMDPQKRLRCELGLGHLNNKALNFGRGAESAKAGAK